ncbi:MAG: UDP-N-acetylmuramate--L-alanine ligase [Spirochaetia bacterium]|jgi:UDP-N-acetylmuramate--alanine ligase|nr:UDP-N-acetylmuramate--L-alanine ligase [Spirochaetia bacterium]
MTKQLLPGNLKGNHIYFIGIKGTGMTALAEIFLSRGAHISGSDTEEKFYTDKILEDLRIPYHEGFSANNLPEKIDFIVHSAAYSIQNNVEMANVSTMDIPLFEYTEALGHLSGTMFSCGIAGVHGKTTTTSIAGTLLKFLNLPGTTLVGSGVAAFGGRSSYTGGEKYFIAETCEYKRHFLHFHPEIIVLTNIETDHMDYFKDYNDIESAFISYINLIPRGGKLIYCSDDIGSSDVASKISLIRPDIVQIPYGEKATGLYKIMFSERREGRNAFQLSGFDCEFLLPVPGKHIILDAAAAIALIVSILEEEGLDIDIEKISEGLEFFGGSKRRSEYKGEYKRILFMDDYGHHPTEIAATLKGLREFYPNKRIIADFMSHTYSRTEALFYGFASCFSDADILVLHEIYSSAREKEGSINGRSLFNEVKKHHNKVYYFHEIEDSFEFYTKLLQKNDLFITIGAGNNWEIGEQLIKHYKGLVGTSFLLGNESYRKSEAMRNDLSNQRRS